MSISGCHAQMSDARRDHVLAGDHGWIDLALNVGPKSGGYDGKKSCLTLESSTPYEPTSLEWVRGEILKLHANNDTSGAAVSRLTAIAIASLALNLLALVVCVVLMRRRR
jgi:hypothetical protein